uniref:Uncharacterized protein n=1 Tax=Lepeophtheirus salmonis TaxID=72036 RepID=A0A0K2TMC8_LEPSM
MSLPILALEKTLSKIHDFDCFSSELKSL